MIWFAGSAHFEYLEVTTTKGTVHMAMFAVSALFGVALAYPRPVMEAASGLVAIAAPYLPKRKGDGEVK